MIYYNLSIKGLFSFSIYSYFLSTCSYTFTCS